MDITIQIMINAATHTLTSHDSLKEAARYINGDFLAVYPVATIADWVVNKYVSREPITSPRTGFIHVMSAPDIPISDIEALLMAPETIPGDQKPLVSKRRNWNITLPPPMQAQMNLNKEVTLLWVPFANATMRKSDNALLSTVM